MQELTARTCTACHGGTPTLDGAQIQAYLPFVENWTLCGGSIERTFAFKNFTEALEFFNRVAEIAEAEGHHPDMGIYGWKNVKLCLYTHAAHGLTENDFIVAAKIDALARSL